MVTSLGSNQEDDGPVASLSTFGVHACTPRLPPYGTSATWGHISCNISLAAQAGPQINGIEWYNDIH